MASNQAIFPFLKLPPELRCAILDYAVDWPHLTETFNDIRPARALPERAEIETNTKRPPLCFSIPHFNSTTTPSILLLNHQTSSEAHEVLYEKTFVLSSPPPYIPQLSKPMDVTEFVSENTLQNLRFVVLEMDLNYNPQFFSGNAKCWLQTIETLLDVWYIQNSLERLEVRARYVPPNRDAGWTFGTADHHRNVLKLISMLRGFGEQVPVVFEGDFHEEKMKKKGPGHAQWYDLID